MDCFKVPINRIAGGGGGVVVCESCSGGRGHGEFCAQVRCPSNLEDNTDFRRENINIMKHSNFKGNMHLSMSEFHPNRQGITHCLREYLKSILFKSSI